MVICLQQGADLHMAQLMPLPLTVSCFSNIQIGFTFLLLAHPGSPGQRAVKRVCVCVCVCGDKTYYCIHVLFVHCELCSGEKVVVCLLCQRTFMHQFSYSEHFQKTHLRHFLHTCSSCGRGFWKRTDKLKHKYDTFNKFLLQGYRLIVEISTCCYVTSCILTCTLACTSMVQFKLAVIICG